MSQWKCTALGEVQRNLAGSGTLELRKRMREHWPRESAADQRGGRYTCSGMEGLEEELQGEAPPGSPASSFLL